MKTEETQNYTAFLEMLSVCIENDDRIGVAKILDSFPSYNNEQAGTFTKLLGNPYSSFPHKSHRETFLVAAYLFVESDKAKQEGRNFDATLGKLASEHLEALATEDSLLWTTFRDLYNSRPNKPMHLYKIFTDENSPIKKIEPILDTDRNSKPPTKKVTQLPPHDPVPHWVLVPSTSHPESHAETTCPVAIFLRPQEQICKEVSASPRNPPQQAQEQTSSASSGPENFLFGLLPRLIGFASRSLQGSPQTPLLTDTTGPFFSSHSNRGGIKKDTDTVSEKTVTPDLGFSSTFTAVIGLVLLGEITYDWFNTKVEYVSKEDVQELFAEIDTVKPKDPNLQECMEWYVLALKHRVVRGKMRSDDFAELKENLEYVRRGMMNDTVPEKPDNTLCKPSR